MTVMDDWVAAACADLGLDPGDVGVPLVLDLARDVAHGVLRPGAPVTAYLLGVAVGRGADPAVAAARLSALALAWSDDRDQPARMNDDEQPAQPPDRKQPAPTPELEQPARTHRLDPPAP